MHLLYCFPLINIRLQKVFGLILTIKFRNRNSGFRNQTLPCPEIHIFKMSFRTEHDTMGEVQIPDDKYWGAQTGRSRNNFKIGPEASMPKEIIAAFAYRR